jgi:hypothetical protein
MLCAALSQPLKDAGRTPVPSLAGARDKNATTKKKTKMRFMMEIVEKPVLLDTGRAN